MPVKEVLCARCGAPLDIDDDVRFVTCAYCSTSLEVDRGDDETTTQAIDDLERSHEELEARQEELERKLDRAERREAIADLEKQWEAERERHCHRDKHGRLVEPKNLRVGGVVLMIFGIAFGAFGQVMGAAEEDDLRERRQRVRALQEETPGYPQGLEGLPPGMPEGLGRPEAPAMIEEDEDFFAPFRMLSGGMGALMFIGGLAMFFVGGSRHRNYQAAKARHEAEVRALRDATDASPKPRKKKARQQQKRRRKKSARKPADGAT